MTFNGESESEQRGERSEQREDGSTTPDDYELTFVDGSLDLAQLNAVGRSPDYLLAILERPHLVLLHAEARRVQVVDASRRANMMAVRHRTKAKRGSRLLEQWRQKTAFQLGRHDAMTVRVIRAKGLRRGGKVFLVVSKRRRDVQRSLRATFGTAEEKVR